MKSKGGLRNQIDCTWAIMCKLSATSQERNQISLFEVIDVFNLPTNYFQKRNDSNKPQIFIFPFEIIINLRRKLDLNLSNEEISLEIKITTIGAKGEPMQEILSPVSIPPGKKNLRVRVPFVGVVADEPGGFSHKIEARKKNSEHDFEILYEVPYQVDSAEIRKS